MIAILLFLFLGSHLVAAIKATASIDLSKFNLTLNVTDSNGYLVNPIYIRATTKHFIVWVDKKIHIFDANVAKKVKTVSVSVSAPTGNEYILDTRIAIVRDKLYYLVVEYGVPFGKIYEINIATGKTETLGVDYIDEPLFYSYPVLKISKNKAFAFVAYATYAPTINSGIRKYNLKTRKEVNRYIFQDKAVSDLILNGGNDNEILCSTHKIALQDNFMTPVPSEIIKFNSNLDAASQKVLYTLDDGYYPEIKLNSGYLYAWMVDNNDIRVVTRLNIGKKGNEIDTLVKSKQFRLEKLGSGDTKSYNYFGDLIFYDKSVLCSTMRASDHAFVFWKSDTTSATWGSGNPIPQSLFILKSPLPTFLSMSFNRDYMWTLNGNVLKKWRI